MARLFSGKRRRPAHQPRRGRLFLDTVETCLLYPESRAGMVSLIRELRARHPDAIIVLNRGWDLLPELGDVPDGLMFESFTPTYDFAEKQYHPLRRSGWDYGLQVWQRLLRPAQEKHGLMVLALDYAASVDAPEVKLAYDRAATLGLVPCVASIQLDSFYDISYVGVRDERWLSPQQTPESRILKLDTERNGFPAGTLIRPSSNYADYNVSAVVDGVVTAEARQALGWRDRAWASRESPGEHALEFTLPAPTRAKTLEIEWAWDSGVWHAAREFRVEALSAGSACYGTSRLMRGVSDYLVAGRCAGRYLLTLSEGAAGLGTITIIGTFEVFYSAGFVPLWWGYFLAQLGLFIALSGFVIYRFRQTRAMTMTQFIETHYSRRFRLFFGGLTFVSGVVNYGIFPAVTVRCFMQFCGIPDTLALGGFDLPMFPALMALELAIAIGLVWMGGQITILVSDYLQAVFCMVMFLALMIFCLLWMPWSDLIAGLATAPEGKSMIHPFRAGDASDFNTAYYLIGAFMIVYTTRAWQGTSGYNASARSPHEARMAGILANWRGMAQNLALLLIPLCVLGAAQPEVRRPGGADKRAPHQHRRPRRARPDDGLGRALGDVAGGFPRSLRDRAGGGGDQHGQHLPALVGQHFHPGRRAAAAQNPARPEAARALAARLLARRGGVRVFL